MRAHKQSGRPTRFLSLERLEERCLLSYTVTDLGSLGGGSSLAIAINDAGQVVGYANSSSGIHAFLWQAGNITDLGTLGGSGSSAWAINSGGQVAGESRITGNTATHAFFYDGNSMMDVGTLSGNNSYARGINSSGQVVGASNFNGGGANDFHAFSGTPGALTDLGTLGGTNSNASAINDTGLIVGASEYPGGGGNTHAFSFDGVAMSDLGTLGGPNSQANGLDAAGNIVGSADTADGFTHAFVYSGGIMTDLGVLPGGFDSTVYSMNAAGQIVGSSDSDSGDLRAMLFDGGLIDLNTQLSNGEGWTLSEAASINNDGWIVGYGRNPNFFQRGFLLTPDGASAPVRGRNPGLLELLEAPVHLAVTIPQLSNATSVVNTSGSQALPLSGLSGMDRFQPASAQERSAIDANFVAHQRERTSAVAPNAWDLDLLVLSSLGNR